MDLFKIKEATINEEYLAQQVEGLKGAAWWKDHKLRISKFDTVYGGNLTGLVPEENTLENVPYVENKLKNSAHDIKRLAKEARGYPVFSKEGEEDKDATKAKERAVALDTIWEEGGGARQEGQLYLDLVRGGFASLAVYKSEDCDYPMYLRLDPAGAYPTVVAGKLHSMLYVETVKRATAAIMFGEEVVPPDHSRKNENVDVVMWFDNKVMAQAVVEKRGKSSTASFTSIWEHDLGRVPVAFRHLDTADSNYRGLLDQLIGPLRGRNRAVRLMLDYLEDMTAAPWEEKGILNPPGSGGPLPGPDAIYHHDPDVEGETFLRRTPPGAPAGAVFGLLNYMDMQEQSEGFQPPSRVGNVRQSIASGSFVTSTQGSLSSVVLEMQGYVSDLRKDAGVIAMKIDEKHLNKKKPLNRAVDGKVAYKPSETFGGWYHHKIAFGAAAGMDRAQSDARVLQHLGAGLIDWDIAREQIDYIENDTDTQDKVDRMLLHKVQFQKLIQDQNVPFSALAQVELLLGKGKTWREALEEVLPGLVAHERQVAEGAAAPGAGGTATPPGATAGPEEQLALEKGATPGAGTEELSDFAPPAVLQMISS